MSRQRIHLPKTDPISEADYSNRRAFIKKLGLGGIALGGIAGSYGLYHHTTATAQDNDREISPALRARILNPGISRTKEREYIHKMFPVKRSPKYKLPGGEKEFTDEVVAAVHNNFYEFTMNKQLVWHLAQGKFKPDPWTIEVTGECHKPRKFSIDDIYKTFGGDQEERAYRFRCVEAWAMDVPWTGFELNKLLKAVEPKSDAKYVKFTTVKRPKEMPGVAQNPYNYTWPYYEALRMDEAMHELTLLCTGIHGRPLPHQHGAPFRIIVPWKYGYKSPKSIVKIELLEKKPGTFWFDLQPKEYPFESNVNPRVPHPRWSQAFERVIPNNRIRQTLLYNGYAEHVAKLYA